MWLFFKKNNMKLRYLIGQNSLAEFRQWFDKQSYSSCFVLTDENTAIHCYQIFLEKSSLQARQIIIPAGEKNKNIQSCEFIWNELLKYGADRKSLLINLGGGMVTDIGGFCAATFMRGIDYVNVPTSLLGMIDASIGGKTGIDLDRYKNTVGCFHEPETTVIYAGFLNTLDQRQLQAAYGEIVKYNLLLPFMQFDLLFEQFGTIPDDVLIRSCINSKIEVVRDDPFETKGIREILNLGHTFGHAFETLCLEKGKKLLHGEAVALGIIAERMLSERIYPSSDSHPGHIRQDYGELTSFILEKFDKSFLNDTDIDRLLAIIKKDKKNIEGKFRFILIDDHGKIKAVFVDEAIIKSVLEQFMLI
jgi:3-dehydroquinate synthase